MEMDSRRNSRRQRISEYIDAHRKSPVAGTVYALIYGPFGCIYTNPSSAVIALLVALALGLIHWPLIGLVWVACVIMAPYQVRAYNAKVRRSARHVVM